jgi:hypothetical protein
MIVEHLARYRALRQREKISPAPRLTIEWTAQL